MAIGVSVQLVGRVVPIIRETVSAADEGIVEQASDRRMSRRSTAITVLDIGENRPLKPTIFADFFAFDDKLSKPGRLSQRG